MRRACVIFGLFAGAAAAFWICGGAALWGAISVYLA